MRASSNNPGFSYFVGVTDNTCSKLQNLTDGASSGRRGIIGSLLDFLGFSSCVDSGERVVACEGAGEAVRDERDCCWKSLNLLVRIRFSNSLASSVASKLSIVLGDPEGRCDLVAIVCEIVVEANLGLS